MRIVSILAFQWIVFFHAANAQEIRESNYQPIDPRHAYSFDANSIPTGSYLSPVDLGWLRFSASPNIRNSNDRNGNYLGPNNFTTDFQLELAFYEPICAVGLRLKSKYPAETDRTHFSLVFHDSEGELIDQLERWPARGTTQQAYSAQNTATGISRILIRNHDGELFAVRKVLALACAIPVS